MSKYEVLIKAVTIQGLSYGQVARLHGVSKTLVHMLHHRWLVEGDAAFEARSRRPKSSPNRTPPSVAARVLELRKQLVDDGHDAGADAILELLAREGMTLSRATIWRLLRAEGRITPQPQKRPRSSWQRFAADRPNELWQSDFTHVVLTTGLDVEVIGWIDDHARYLLHLSAHPRISGRIVIDTFTAAAAEHGYPAATLTDNGMVYTTRYARNARGIAPGNGFEILLALQGITQKNGRPFPPAEYRRLSHDPVRGVEVARDRNADRGQPMGEISELGGQASRGALDRGFRRPIHAPGRQERRTSVGFSAENSQRNPV